MHNVPAHSIGSPHDDHCVHVCTAWRRERADCCNPSSLRNQVSPENPVTIIRGGTCRNSCWAVRAMSFFSNDLRKPTTQLRKHVHNHQNAPVRPACAGQRHQVPQPGPSKTAYKAYCEVNLRKKKRSGGISMKAAWHSIIPWFRNRLLRAMFHSACTCICCPTAQS